jgi:hypothetical protein
MSNDPKADLIYALLAMDSYNRGYGSGIKDLGQTSGTKLGAWEIIRNADDSQGLKTAFNAGFYAIAYKNSETNEIVVSFRGTDYNLDFDDEYDPRFTHPEQGGSDLTNGYGLALGYTTSVVNATIGVEQVRLAQQFYNRIPGTQYLIIRHNSGDTILNRQHEWSQFRGQFRGHNTK